MIKIGPVVIMSRKEYAHSRLVNGTAKQLSVLFGDLDTARVVLDRANVLAKDFKTKKERLEAKWCVYCGKLVELCGCGSCK